MNSRQASNVSNTVNADQENQQDAQNTSNDETADTRTVEMDTGEVTLSEYEPDVGIPEPPEITLTTSDTGVNTILEMFTITEERLNQLQTEYGEYKDTIQQLKTKLKEKTKELEDRARQYAKAKTNEDIQNATNKLQDQLESTYENLKQTEKILNDIETQTETMGPENIDLFLKTIEGTDEALQVAALENEDITIADPGELLIPSYDDMLKSITAEDQKELERESDIFDTSLPPQDRKKIGMDPPPDDDDDDDDGDPPKKNDDDDGGKKRRKLRIRPPGRYGLPSPVEPNEDDIPQLSYGGHQAYLPTFITLNIDSEALVMLTAEVAKLEQCPIDPQDCLFDHSVSTPFASTGTNYSKLECIPFCNQHLLSVFGIGLEYGKQIVMDKYCKRKNTTFGPFAVAKSYNRKPRYAFRKYECIYPGIRDANVALGGALSALFSRREDLPSMHFTKNILNTFYYVLDSSDITIKDICKPYDLLKKGNCDAGVFDVLATMIAFLIWGNNEDKIEPLSLAPYVNNLEFILTVAKKLIQLNRMTKECYEKTYQTPLGIFRLKLFDYETENHGLPPLHPTTVRRHPGIVATRDICQDERLTCKFDSDVLDKIYFKFKNHSEYTQLLKDNRDKFVKPPTNAISASERTIFKSGFRISKHTLSDVADNCLGDYGNFGKLTAGPLKPLPPIVLKKPSSLPKRKVPPETPETRNKKIKAIQDEFKLDLVDRYAKNRLSAAIRDGLSRSVNDTRSARDLKRMVDLARKKTVADKLTQVQKQAEKATVALYDFTNMPSIILGDTRGELRLPIGSGNRTAGRPARTANVDVNSGASTSGAGAGASGGPTVAVDMPADQQPSGRALGGEQPTSNLVGPEEQPTQPPGAV